MTHNYTHIILADDDEDDRLFFTDAFDELKMQTKVSTFNDGVYLMEYLNPGIECLKEIKANSKFKNITIAIYSTSASEEDIEDTFVKGANIYIKKPSDFKKLKKVLSNVVTRNWQYETSGLNRDNFLLRL